MTDSNVLFLWFKFEVEGGYLIIALIIALIVWLIEDIKNIAIDRIKTIGAFQ